MTKIKDKGLNVCPKLS